MAKPQFALVECARHQNLLCRLGGFVPDGRSVVGLLTNGPYFQGIGRWDAETGKLKDVRPEHQENVWTEDGAILSSNHRSFAVLAHNIKNDTRAVWIYDAVSLERTATIEFLETGAHYIAWSPDSTLIAVQGSQELFCWNIKGQKKVASFKQKYDGELGVLRFLDFLPEGREIVSCFHYGVSTWEIATGKSIRRVKFKDQDGSFRHALSGIRSTLISHSNAGFILQTDTNSWKLRRFDLEKNSLSANPAFCPDGRLVATAAGNGVLYIWNADTCEKWLKWKKPGSGYLSSLAFSPDANRLACVLDFRLFILDFKVGAASRQKPVALLPVGKLQCGEMVGGETQMDLEKGHYDPANPLPVKCPHCRMPDLDHVAEPYVLGFGTASPADLSAAANGNFLIRESAKRVLELVVPGQCAFRRTAHLKTKEALPWFLAVPVNLETTATPPKKRERCPKCGEAWCFHVESETANCKEFQSPIAFHDVFKSKNWSSVSQPFKGWGSKRPEILGRCLYFSIRLERLFKKLGMRGLNRYIECREEPSPSDLAWVEEKYKLVQAALKSGAKTGTGPDSADGFENYLKGHERKPGKRPDFSTVESRERVKLPDSYKKFITQVGSKKFKNVEGEAGFNVRILPPNKLDFDEFRKKGDEDDSIRGVVFADTEHGDALCFELGGKSSDYPVVHFNHEVKAFEPFATNFAECIKRLAKTG